MAETKRSQNKKEIGKAGEQVVRAHLERTGRRILAMNFRCTAGEMDIIAEEQAGQDKTLVFIEVKTRRGADHGTPLEAVDARKQKRLAAIAMAYLAALNLGGAEPAFRFDVAEVRTGPDGLSDVRLHSVVLGA